MSRLIVMLNLCCAPIHPAWVELEQVKTESPANIKHAPCDSARYIIITLLTLTFSEGEILNDVDLVRVLGVEGRRVVLDDAAVEDPLDPGHGVARDLAAQRGVAPRPPHHGGLQHLDLGLAGEVLGADLGPHLARDPLRLVTHSLRGVSQKILLDNEIPKLLEFAVARPGVVME